MELDSIEVLKKVATKLVDERLFFDRHEDGKYKITVLTTEDIENRKNAEEDEESISEEERPKENKENEQKESDGVKTIIEEVSDPHSESAHN
jgi:hypothetical protein